MGTYLVPHNEPSSFIPPVHCFTTHTHTSPVLPCQEFSPLDHTVGHVPKQINEFSLQAHNGPTQIFVSPHNLAMTQTTRPTMFSFYPHNPSTFCQPFAILQPLSAVPPSISTTLNPSAKFSSTYLTLLKQTHSTITRSSNHLLINA